MPFRLSEADQVCWYPLTVTTVEITYRYAAPPTEQVAMALACARDVYGIRQLSFDRQAHTVRIEFDATRLNASSVAKLLRNAGLEIDEDVQQLPDPKPAPATPAA
ncbi:MAG: hypothetical protein ACRD3S_02780 [Terracidiphilus sp.]